MKNECQKSSKVILLDFIVRLVRKPPVQGLARFIWKKLIVDSLEHDLKMKQVSVGTSFLLIVVFFSNYNFFLKKGHLIVLQVMPAFKCILYFTSVFLSNKYIRVWVCEK